jgi:hypothetical protein
LIELNPPVTPRLLQLQSLISRLPSKNGPPLSRSGVYLARSIAKQALHVVNRKEINQVKRGNQINHPSLLNNIELKKVLFAWAASQEPGHVRLFSYD